MRLMECLRLRVKDIDFARNEITVRNGKGGKDRRTVLPRSLAEPLKREVERALPCTETTTPKAPGSAYWPTPAPAPPALVPRAD